MRNGKGPSGWVLGGWSINGFTAHLRSAGDGIAERATRRTPEPLQFERPANIVAGQAVDRVFVDGRSITMVQHRRLRPVEVRRLRGGRIFSGRKGYGNAGVSLFDAPAQKTWDFALFKEFRVRKEGRLQFRSRRSIY